MTGVLESDDNDWEDAYKLDPALTQNISMPLVT